MSALLNPVAPTPPRGEARALLLAAGLMLAAAVMALGCARRPATAAVLTGCGPMPPPPDDCRLSLPRNATDADVVRCTEESLARWRADAKALRIQFAPCAKP